MLAMLLLSLAFDLGYRRGVGVNLVRQCASLNGDYRVLKGCSFEMVGMRL